MSKHRNLDYDDYDDDYGDGYADEHYEEGVDGEGEQPVDYVEYIRSKLAKGVRIADDAIIAQLEVYDYDVKEVLKAIEKQTAKKAPVGGKAAPKGQQAAKAAATKPAGTAKPAAKVTAPGKPETVFTKAVAAGPKEEAKPAEVASVEELGLSDTDSAPSFGIELEPDHSKPHITMVVVGHVDAGKSTLVGHLVHKLGQINTRTIDKYDKESRSIGKPSFAYAWVMDERQSEREHGVTIDIAERMLVTDRFSFTLLDSPGHRDFVPNMIKGAAAADVALLVVPASAGEFESALSTSAQTREHAVLLKALGVNQVIVVVNKMDSTLLTAWSQERYHTIEGALRSLLVQELHFNEASIRCVPISGLDGQNLVSISEDCPLKAWYDGPSLMEAMNTFNPPHKQVDRPFRARAMQIDAEPGRGSSRNNTFTMSVLQGRIAVGRTVGVAKCSAGRVHLYAAKVLGMDEEQPQHGKKVSSDKIIAVAREQVVVQLSIAK